MKTVQYALILTFTSVFAKQRFPSVINTWGFRNATQEAWDIMYRKGGSALDAIERGCSKAEEMQVDGTVGWGGSPDENGESTLDALIMDGPTHDVGAVANLHRVKNAISVARKVLEHTRHSFLVGDSATDFAKQMGFKEENISSTDSINMWQIWKNSCCQPNFWKNVVPDSSESCGPYYPTNADDDRNEMPLSGDKYNHDTIGMIAIDKDGRIACGTSTNGSKFKIPGWKSFGKLSWLLCRKCLRLYGAVWP